MPGASTGQMALSQRLANQAMPALILPTSGGGTVALDGLPMREGATRAVVFIYPWSGRPGIANPPHWDDIPGAHGSTPQAAAFAMLHGAYLGAGVEVYGLSGQSRAWQQEFATRLGLPFELISDETLQLARLLDLPVFETGGVRFLERLTLVVGGGRILRAIHPVPRPETHASELIEVLTGG